MERQGNKPWLSSVFPVTPDEAYTALGEIWLGSLVRKEKNMLGFGIMLHVSPVKLPGMLKGYDGMGRTPGKALWRHYLADSFH